MDHTTSLFLIMLLSAIGTGFIVYGKKQRRGVAFLCGIVLCVYPYFVDSVFILLLIAAVLIAVPFVVRY